MMVRPFSRMANFTLDGSEGIGPSLWVSVDAFMWFPSRAAGFVLTRGGSALQAGEGRRGGFGSSYLLNSWQKWLLECLVKIITVLEVSPTVLVRLCQHPVALQ